MVKLNANPNAGHRPNLTGRKPRPTAPCPKCGQVRLMFVKNSCKPCYTAEHPTKEGNCVACGRWMKLPYRGLCDRCTHVLPPGSGVNLRRRVIGADEAKAAAAVQQAFVEVIAPKVQRIAGRRLWQCPLQERLELIAEAVALAWEIYLGQRKRGYDGLRDPTLLAKRVVGKVLFGRRFAGGEDIEDVLSRRRRKQRNVIVTAATDDCFVAHREPDTAAEIDRKEWLARLGADDRRVVEFLAQGNNWEDAKAHFGMTAHQVGVLLERLWESRQEGAAH